MKLFRFAGAALLVCFACGSAIAEEKPLWEAGLGIGALRFPDYRGSDESQVYPVPVPYFVYRGDFFKADKDGVRGEIFDHRYAELTISLNATIPVRSEDNHARTGMPDLKPTVELGPSLDVHLWRSADERMKFALVMPLRLPLTVEATPRSIGWVFAPRFNLDVDDIRGSQFDGRLRAAGSEPGKAVAESEYAAHPVLVVQLQHGRTHHVVDARAQPATRDDGCAGLRRVEVDHRAWTSLFERERALDRTIRSHFDLVEHPPVIGHVVGDLVAGDGAQRERGGQCCGPDRTDHEVLRVQRLLGLGHRAKLYKPCSRLGQQPGRIGAGRSRTPCAIAPRRPQVVRPQAPLEVP